MNNNFKLKMKNINFKVLLLCLGIPSFSIVTYSAEVGGFPMPTLQDEKDTYTHFGKTWAKSAEPNYSSAGDFKSVNPDVHGDTEGDDLWTSLMMFRRTGQKGYWERAQVWADYFKTKYRKSSSFQEDYNGYGADHIWGWGLVALYEHNGDQAALAEAEKLAEVVEKLWTEPSDYGCVPKSGCLNYGTRLLGRHLHLVTRVAEATGKQRWVTLRDKILKVLMNSQYWDERGMYFGDSWAVDQLLGEGAFIKGDRATSPFMTGVLIEGMSQAWRVTKRKDIADRIVAMARFVDKYGMDEKYKYTASSFGIVNGKIYHKYSAVAGTVTFWDPVYTTSLVNTLMMGYKLTGDKHFYERAFYFFERGNKGIYGEPLKQSAGVNEINHFVDTRFFYGYYDYNKGELQYTYHVFENPGKAASTSISIPTNFKNKPGMLLNGSLGLPYSLSGKWQGEQTDSKVIPSFLPGL